MSTNLDEATGKLIADAIEKVEKEGVITVEDGKGLHNELEHLEGIQSDHGFLSAYCINQPETQGAMFDDPFILLYDKRIILGRNGS